MRPIATCLFSVFPAVCCVSGDAEAQWVRNVNPVCDAQYDQSLMTVISDGIGGIMVVWSYERGGEYEEEGRMMLFETDPPEAPPLRLTL